MLRSSLPAEMVDAPFFGIDLSKDARHLSPRHARDCFNVHCAFDGIEVRPGSALMFNQALPNKIENLYWHRKTTGDVDGQPFALAVTSPDSTTWEISFYSAALGPQWNHVKLIPRVPAGSGPIPTFCSIDNRHVMVLCQGVVPFAVDQNGASIQLGVDPPSFPFVDTNENFPVFPSIYEGGGIGITSPGGWSSTEFPRAYRYGFSFEHYDADNPILSTESNAIFPPEAQVGYTALAQDQYGDASVGLTPEINIDPNIVNSLGSGASPTVTHVNVYRANATYTVISQQAGTFTAYATGPYYHVMRLTRQEFIDLATAQVDPYTILDIVPDENRSLLRIAPTLNGRPPKAGVACRWQNRMFYGRIHDGLLGGGNKGQDRFYASANGKWFHVAQEAASEILVGNDGAPITAMVDFFDQLIVMKEESLWRLTGTFNGPTNATRGTGQDDPFPEYDFGMVTGTCGCGNTSGAQSAVEIEDVLYFAGPTGFWAYTGQTIQRISIPIEPLLRNMLNSEGLRRCTVAHDRERELILWCVPEVALGASGSGQGPSIPTSLTSLRYIIFAYHYRDAEPGSGAGRWTPWGSDQNDFEVSCIATQHLSETPAGSQHGGLQRPILGRTDGYASNYSTTLSKDEITSGVYAGLDWRWVTGMFTAGVASRTKHWRHLDVGYEPQAAGTFAVSVLLDQEQTARSSVTFDQATQAVSTARPGTNTSARRLGFRSSAISFQFSGSDTENPTRIVSFSADYERFGTRTPVRASS